MWYYFFVTWMLLKIFISGDVFNTPGTALYQFDSYEACQKKLFELFDTETNRNNTPGKIIEGDFGIPYTINISKNDVRIYRYCLEPDDFYLDKKLKKD